jgi:hypothetical protein
MAECDRWLDRFDALEAGLGLQLLVVKHVKLAPEQV